MPKISTDKTTSSNWKQTTRQHYYFRTNNSLRQGGNSSLTNQNWRSYPLILLLKFHPVLAKSSFIVFSKMLQFFKIKFFTSSLNNCDHFLAQKVPLKITCKYDLGAFWQKIASFRHNQIAQHKAIAPTNSCFLTLQGKPLSQEPNKLSPTGWRFQPRNNQYKIPNKFF